MPNSVELVTVWRRTTEGPTPVFKCLGGREGPLMAEIYIFCFPIFFQLKHEWHLWILLYMYVKVTGQVMNTFLFLFALGYDPVKQCIVEIPGEKVQTISGMPLFDNHSVNLISSFIMCLLTPSIALSAWEYFI